MHKKDNKDKVLGEFSENKSGIRRLSPFSEVTIGVIVPSLNPGGYPVPGTSGTNCTRYTDYVLYLVQKISSWLRAQTNLPSH